MGLSTVAKILLQKKFLLHYHTKLNHTNLFSKCLVSSCYQSVKNDTHDAHYLVQMFSNYESDCIVKEVYSLFFMWSVVTQLWKALFIFFILLVKLNFPVLFAVTCVNRLQHFDIIRSWASEWFWFWPRSSLAYFVLSSFY